MKNCFKTTAYKSGFIQSDSTGAVTVLVDGKKAIPVKSEHAAKLAITKAEKERELSAKNNDVLSYELLKNSVRVKTPCYVAFLQLPLTADSVNKYKNNKPLDYDIALSIQQQIEHNKDVTQMRLSYAIGEKVRHYDNKGANNSTNVYGESGNVYRAKLNRFSSVYGVECYTVEKIAHTPALGVGSSSVQTGLNFSPVQLNASNELSRYDKKSLEGYVLQCVERLTGEPFANYHLVEATDSLENYQALKDYMDNSNGINTNIPVLQNGDTLSIFGPDLNELMRYWHDLTHYSINQNFGFEGETKTANNQLEQLLYVNAPIDLIGLVYCDSYGQNAYYNEHKRFINDGGAYVALCAEIGIESAVRTYKGA